MVRLFRVARMRADTDTEDVPGEDWRSILWRVLKGILEDRILYTSGGVAFFTLLSFFLHAERVPRWAAISRGREAIAAHGV
jgi:hypothetical protein